MDGQDKDEEGTFGGLGFAFPSTNKLIIQDHTPSHS